MSVANHRHAEPRDAKACGTTCRTLKEHRELDEETAMLERERDDARAMLERERDDARAEVERLGGILARASMCCMCSECQYASRRP
jgi:hypothetical protein